MQQTKMLVAVKIRKLTAFKYIDNISCCSWWTVITPTAGNRNPKTPKLVSSTGLTCLVAIRSWAQRSFRADFFPWRCAKAQTSQPPRRSWNCVHIERYVNNTRTEGSRNYNPWINFIVVIRSVRAEVSHLSNSKSPKAITLVKRYETKSKTRCA